MKTSLFILLNLWCALAQWTQDTQWESYKQTFKKYYTTFDEDNLRRSLFYESLEVIQTHNTRYIQGLETYQMDLNTLSDMTSAEIQIYTHNLVKIEESLPDIIFSSNTSLLGDVSSLPTSFDWVSRGIISPVKNQNKCSSSYAFATTAAIEAHYKFKSGVTVTLSEQQLIDCNTRNFGCSGGWPAEAFSYVKVNGGINFDTAYPYVATPNIACFYNSSQQKIAIKGFATISPLIENALKLALYAQGPVVTAFDASGSFRHYSDGIYYNPSCSATVTHAVLIVGYGTLNGMDYWLAKNCWGSNWGSSGFFKIARNRNNHCGIASDPYYPLL